VQQLAGRNFGDKPECDPFSARTVEIKSVDKTQGRGLYARIAEHSSELHHIEALP
jgi:hypothetical protein